MNTLVAQNASLEPDTNAGNSRLAAIVGILVEAGHRVTFLAQKYGDERYRRSLARVGARCVVDSEDCCAREDGVRTLVEGDPRDVAILLK
jgi:hypothetical protein